MRKFKELINLSLRPLRPCNHSGCPNLVISGRCPQHSKQVQQQYDRQRGSAVERGYDYQWAKFRAIYLSAHPLCTMCEDKGYIVKADLIHHKTPLDQGGSKYNEDNLQALCNDCHEEIHGKDRFKHKV